jgi:hypothetical protein
MKRLLLSLAFMGAVLLGNAQTPVVKSPVILNEIYTLPSPGNSEFFELYNTSVSPNAIPLDCYSLVVMYTIGDNKDVTKITRGFYIIDFPSNASIASQSYFVGASKNPFAIQNKPTNTADFSWNSLGGATGGSLKKYELVGNGFVDVTNAPGKTLPTDFNNLFSQMAGAMTIDYAVFLFDDQGNYINGLITNPNQKNGSVPSTIYNLPSVTVSTSCLNESKNLVIDWSKIRNSEFASSNDGTDNGFIRTGDGFCGKWVKANSNHSPRDKNLGSGTSNPNSAITTYTQKSYCGQRIDFLINTGADVTPFDVEVQLYIDNGTNGPDGVFGVGDVYVTSYSPLVKSNSNTTYSFLQDDPGYVLDPTKSYIIVYKSSLGCIERIGAVTPVAGVIQPEVLSYCKQTIEYSVLPNNLTPEAFSYIFPVTVELLYDFNGNGSIDPGVEQIAQKTDEASSLSDLKGIFEKVDPAYQAFLVFKSVYSCYMPIEPVKPFVRGGTINPIAFSYCGQRVDFKIPKASLGAIKYAFPVWVELYEEVSINGRIDADEPMVGGPTRVDNASDFLYSFTKLDPTKQYLLNFRADNEVYSCYMPAPLRPIPVVGSFETVEKNFCDKEIDATVTGATVPASLLDQNEDPFIPTVYPEYAMPVGVSLYYDLNGNNQLDIGIDRKDIESDTIRSFNEVLSFNLDAGFENAKKFIVYSSRTSCFTKEVSTMPAALAPGNLTTQQFYVPVTTSEKSFVRFDVTGINAQLTEAADFPVEITVFEDTNDNEVLDSTIDLKAGTKLQVTTASTLDTIQLNSRYTNVFVRYKTARGCVDLVVFLTAPSENLPVKFTSFTAARNKQNKQQVEVSWTTAQEQNNKGFYIQRKTGNEWKDVAFVFSAAEGGNSSEALTYRFKDANTHPGVSQYRLLQVDLDGKATYSNIVSLMGEAPKSSVMVFPNPAVGGNVNLVFADADAAKQVLVSDLSGRLVQQFRNITTGSHAISGLKTGFYTIKVTNTKTGETTVEKIIVP